MSARWGFSIDLDRCIGCQACAVACRTGNALPAGEAFIAIRDVVRRDAHGALWGSFAHRRCFHCDAAACVSVCPTGALSRRDGLTVVAADRCSGCSYCADACPFHVPHVQDDQIRKCVACAEQVSAGARPWCEQTCPTQAIRFGDRDALLREAQDRVAFLRERHPRAQIYGETQLGGLGLLTILLDDPAVYGLPARPERPRVVDAWAAGVRPATAALSAAAVAGTGLLFLAARRRRVREAERGGEGERAADEEGRDA